MMNGIDWKACGIDGKIWTAYSAESALKILNTQEIHLMLCDIEMSGDNGIDLLRSIRGINKEIACIFLTCHANFEYAQDAISLGCSDYILKTCTLRSHRGAREKGLCRASEKASGSRSW